MNKREQYREAMVHIATRIQEAKEEELAALSGSRDDVHSSPDTRAPPGQPDDDDLTREAAVLDKVAASWALGSPVRERTNSVRLQRELSQDHFHRRLHEFLKETFPDSFVTGLNVPIKAILCFVVASCHCTNPFFVDAGVQMRVSPLSLRAGLARTP